MNHRKHRLTTVAAAVVAAAMTASIFTLALSPAQAQTLPDAVCEPLKQQIDTLKSQPGLLNTVGDRLERNVYEPLCVGDSPLPSTPSTTVPGVLLVCETINTAEQTINDSDEAPQEVKDEFPALAETLRDTANCQPPPEDDDEEEEDPEEIHPDRKGPRVTSQDGLIKEVGRLVYQPINRDGNEGRSAVLLDSGTRRGYRIYAKPEAGFGKPRIHSFDLDTLQNEDSQEYEFNMSLPAAGSNPSVGTEVIATAGADHAGKPKLFVVDDANRIHVIDGKTLEREGSFAPTLPARADPTGAVGDTLQSIQQERSPVLPQSTITAVTYLPPHAGLKSGKLLVFIESIRQDATIPGATFLAQWDIATKKEDWSTRLNACSSRQANAHLYSSSIAVSQRPGDPELRDVLLGCFSSNGRSEVWKIGLAPDSTSVNTQSLITIVPNATGFLPDPAGRRFGVLVTTGSGDFVVGVDVDRRGGVYGAAQLSPAKQKLGAGVDPSTGRIYGFSQSSSVGDGDAGGVLVVDGRRQPLPQKFGYGELNPLDQTGRDRLTVDPGTSSRPTRVFVPLSGDDPMIRVYEDRRPVVANTPLTEADRFTQDIDEEEGKTRVSTTATSSAYGVRVWLTGGVYHLFPPETIVHDTVIKDKLRAACEPHNRELILAEISPNGTVLSNSGVNGAAVAARLDERTRQDLNRPAAACWPTEGLFSDYDNVANVINSLTSAALAPAETVYDEQIKDTHVPIGSSDPDDDGPTIGDLLGMEDLPRQPVPTWPEQAPGAPDELWRGTIRDPAPFFPAVCSRPGEASERPLPDDHPDHGEDDYVVDVLGTSRSLGPAPGFTALAACGRDGHSLVANATAGALDSAAVSFDGASTVATMTWKKDGGVVNRIESSVEGVSIAGVLRIGEVRSVALSQAAGRPGTARSSITREWCGIVGLSGEQDNRSGCQNVDDPEFQERLRQFNENVLSRRGFELRATPIDPELRSGTPGGALAALQKDRFLVAGESFLNNDGRSNVAALELIEVTDTGANRSRHIYQLAGVETSASYNISPIPQFDFQPFGLPTFDGAGTLPPAASEILGAADRRTPQRVLGAQPAGNTNPSVGPPAAGGLVEALGSGLRWLLRNPLEALKFMALLATAWALPLHLHEKRRMLSTATVPGRN